MRFAFLKDHFHQCGEWIRRDKRVLLLREGIERGKDKLRGLGWELTELGRLDDLEGRVWRLQASHSPLGLVSGPGQPVSPCLLVDPRQPWCRSGDAGAMSMQHSSLPKWSSRLPITLPSSSCFLKNTLQLSLDTA